MNNIDELLTQWETYMMSKQRSHNTIKAYKRNLATMIQYFDDFINIDIENIEKFKIYLLTSGKDGKTINQYRSAGNSFFKYLQRKKIIHDNAFSLLESAKSETKYQGRLTTDELKQIYNILDNSKHKNTSRNLLVFQLALKLGLRKSEIAKLTLNDVSSNIWNIKTKGGYYRLIDISPLPEIRTYITEYLKNRLTVDSEFLLIGSRGNALTDDGVGEILEVLGKRINVAKCTAHTFRRTLSTLVELYTKDNALATLVLGQKPTSVSGKNYTDPMIRATQASNIVKEMCDAYEIR